MRVPGAELGVSHPFAEQQKKSIPDRAKETAMVLEESLRLDRGVGEAHDNDLEHEVEDAPVGGESAAASRITRSL